MSYDVIGCLCFRSFLFSNQEGMEKMLFYRSSRHCGNVYNRTLYGAVGNGVCRVWESHDFSMLCEWRFPSVE